MTTVSEQRVIEYNVPHYYKSPPAPVFEVGAALQIHGQSHRTDLNGKYVVCLGRDGMRTLVLTRVGDSLSVSDSHLQVADPAPAVGARVTLVGLHELDQFNGSLATIESIQEDGYTVKLIPGESAPGESQSDAVDSFQVKNINIVLTPEGTDLESGGNLVPLGAGKKRRLIANLVDTARPALAGAPQLLSGQPVPGATARLIAIDAAVALSNQQPILKRCGTLRKLVHGFPGFAQLVVCLVAKLHRDPTHPGRQLAPEDVQEALKIAGLLTEGKLDGVPRRELKELVAAGEVSLESVLRLADRYCGAVHLVFAIDSNFAGVKDTIMAMVHRITGGVPPSAPAAADLLMQDDSSPKVASPPQPGQGLSIDPALTSIMASRYAAPKPADDMMDTSDK